MLIVYIITNDILIFFLLQYYRIRHHYCSRHVWNTTFVKRIHALQPGGTDKLNIPTSRAMKLYSIIPFDFYNPTVLHRSQSHVQLQGETPPLGPILPWDKQLR